jgi:hypothetical protein
MQSFIVSSKGSSRAEHKSTFCFLSFLFILLRLNLIVEGSISIFLRLLRLNPIIEGSISNCFYIFCYRTILKVACQSFASVNKFSKNQVHQCIYNCHIITSVPTGQSINTGSFPNLTRVHNGATRTVTVT